MDRKIWRREDTERDMRERESLNREREKKKTEREKIHG